MLIFLIAPRHNNLCKRDIGYKNKNDKAFDVGGIVIPQNSFQKQKCIINCIDTANKELILL